MTEVHVTQRVTNVVLRGGRGIVVCESPVTSVVRSAPRSTVVIGQAGRGGSYVHEQSVASDTWIIPHNLGYFPAVTAIDQNGSTLIGSVEHVSVYEARVIFTSPFAGTAYCS